jgi:hypothetical protein
MPWVVLGVAIIVAAIVVTVVLVSDDSGGSAGGTSTTDSANSTDDAESEATYDLSTPQRAARSLGEAAETGDDATLLELTCAGHPDCVRQQDPDATDEDVDAAQNDIRERLEEFTELVDATLAPPNDGDAAGVKEVRYLTPDMSGDEYGAVSFVEFEGDWLYYAA